MCWEIKGASVTSLRKNWHWEYSGGMEKLAMPSSDPQRSLEYYSRSVCDKWQPDDPCDTNICLRPTFSHTSKYMGRETRVKTGLCRKQDKEEQGGYTIETRRQKERAFPGWENEDYLYSVSICWAPAVCWHCALALGMQRCLRHSFCSDKTHSNIQWIILLVTWKYNTTGQM